MSIQRLILTAAVILSACGSDLPAVLEPQRLVVIHKLDAVGQQQAVEPPIYEALRQDAESVRLAAYTHDGELHVEGHADAAVRRVSSNFFRIFGAEPVLGRVFVEEEQAPDAGDVVVLGYHYWLGQMAGDPTRIGSELTLDGASHTVLGVMPEGFPGSGVDLWRPLKLSPEVWASGTDPALVIIGRLGYEADLEDARAEVQDVAGSEIHMTPWLDTLPPRR